jgi:membrane-associated protease RseP (regulator of RpoE activity)
LISFKLRGVTLRVEFSFLVFNALVFLFRDSTLILAFYTTCALHESGHILALGLTGGRLSSVSFGAAGIRMETVRTGAEPVMRSLFVLLAGPAVNILVFAAMKLIGCGGTFPVLNLCAAAYNMLPFRNLDGGAVIALFTLGTPHERTAELVLKVIRLIIIVFAALAFLDLSLELRV